MIKKKIGLSILFLVFFLIPSVKATTTIFEPEIGLTEPEMYYSVYVDERGILYPNRILTPIVRTGVNEDTFGGILFTGISINNAEKINSAELRLYFDNYLDTSSIPVLISIYGIKETFQEGSTLEGFSRTGPITDHVSNYDLQGVTSGQWIEIDVTKIVQELINRHNWSTNQSLGFKIFGATQDTKRGYQSNIGLNYPKLEITYGEYPPPSEPGGYFIESYKSHVIYKSFAGEIYITDDYLGNEYLNFYSEGYPYQQHSVYSNASDCWYIFYSLSETDEIETNGMRYAIITNSGEVLNMSLPFASGLFNFAPYGDYDLKIDRTGKYIWFFGLDSGLEGSPLNKAQDGVLILPRIIVNETSKDLYFDINSTWTYIDVLDGTSTEDELKGILGGITYNGYPFFTVQDMGSSGQYFPLAGFSQNKTVFELDYQANIETLYINKVGDNPWSRSWNMIIGAFPLSNGGVMIHLAPSDELNYYNDKWVSIPCNNYSLLNGAYDASDWGVYTEIRAKLHEYGLYNNWCFSYDYDDHFRLIKESINPSENRILTYFEWSQSGQVWTSSTIETESTGIQNVPLLTQSKDFGWAMIEGDLDDEIFYSHRLNITWQPQSMLWNFGSINNGAGNIEHNRATGSRYQNSINSVIVNDGWSTPYQDVFVYFFNVFNQSQTGSVYIVYDENGTIASDDCLTLECAKAFIDGVSPIQSDDPDPPGWDEEGAFTRAKIRFYLLIIGWLIFWLPIYFWAWGSKGVNKIIFVWVVLICMLIGLGILWTIPHI